MPKEKNMTPARQAITVVIVIALIFTLLAGLGIFAPQDRPTQTTEPQSSSNPMPQ
jgi:hypothetical protein